jgi:hypothetical protein
VLDSSVDGHWTEYHRKTGKVRNTNLEIGKFLHGIVRSWMSQTKNPTKFNFDESQLPGK